MSMRVDLLGSIQKCLCKARACSYLIPGILTSKNLKMSRAIFLIVIFLQVFYFRPAFIFTAQLTFSIGLLMQFFCSPDYTTLQRILPRQPSL